MNLWYCSALLLIGISTTLGQFEVPTPYTWRCEGEADAARCVRHINNGLSEGTPMHTCKLTCGTHGMLWPKPSFAQLGREVREFHADNLHMEIEQCKGEVCQLLPEAFDIFRDNINRYHPDYNHTTRNVSNDDSFASPRSVRNHNVTVKVDVHSDESRLSLKTDESYSLNVNQFKNNTHIAINATTYFGARHALETLSQLIAYCENNNGFQIITEAIINDSPVYPYRGILLDTSRNFFPVEDIKRTIDGMAANKLNTFHWHITDSHSFPMKLNSLPNMHYYGAYTPKQVYEPKDIREVVEYGRIRGVRILPEFDAPAHVGNGFQWGEMHGLGKLAVCVNKEPWQSFCVEPPCGQLNIANDKMYDVLSGIYKEMAEMFSPIDLFHFGGDEVNLNCWNSTQEIVDWMTAKNNSLSTEDYYKEWSNFQTKAQKLFTEANEQEVPGIIWTSHLTELGNSAKYLDPSKYIIQIWTTESDPIIKDVLQNDFNVIFSNYDAWYLDCGFGAWVGEGNNWCSPYKGWQKVYDNSPAKMAGPDHLTKIKGGEAALWTEQVDSSTIDSRLWPRSSALAERLWSEPEHNWEPAEIRFINHRQRLVQRGIKADRIQPQWCHQNEKLCYL